MSRANGLAGRGAGTRPRQVEEDVVDEGYRGYLMWLLTNHRRIGGDGAVRNRRPLVQPAPAGDEHSVAESACTEVAEDDEVVQPLPSSVEMEVSSGSHVRARDLGVQEVEQQREGSTPERPIFIEEGDDEGSSSRPFRGRRSSRYFLRRRD